MRYISICITATVLAAGLSSCGSTAHLPRVETRDSVVVVTRDSTVYRDSILFVQVPGEAYAVETYNDSSHLETSIAESDAVVRGGKLTHTLRNKPTSRLQTKVALPSRYIITTATTASQSQIREVVEVEKKLTSWQSFLLVLGKIAFGVLVLLFVWLAVKVFLLRDF